MFKDKISRKKLIIIIVVCIVVASIMTGVLVGTLTPFENISIKGMHFRKIKKSGKGYNNYELISYTGQQEEVVIPSKVRGVPVVKIGSNVFEKNNSITKISVPDSIIDVASSCFAKCVNLKYNQFDNALYIGNEKNPYVLLIKATDVDIKSCEINSETRIICGSAFIDCNFLEDIIIPDKVIDIGYRAFDSCENLKSIHIPKSLTHIGEYAFAIRNLENTYITDLTAWCNIDFEGYPGIGNLYLNNKLITELIIPEGVTEIKSRAFCGCTSIKSVTLPTSVRLIDDNAFAGCTELVNINIPSQVYYIGEAAFWYCKNLKEIFIPESVRYIKDSAFYNCSSLTIYCEASKFSGQFGLWDDNWNPDKRPVEYGCTWWN